LWTHGCILHQDNAPAHKVTWVRQLLVVKQIPTLEHALYSQELAPCDLFLLPKFKISLEVTHFQSVEEIHKKMAGLLKGLSQNDLRRCFESWKARAGRCVASDGNYFEGDNMVIHKFSQ